MRHQVAHSVLVVSTVAAWLARHLSVYADSVVEYQVHDVGNFQEEQGDAAWQQQADNDHVLCHSNLTQTQHCNGLDQSFPVPAPHVQNHADDPLLVPMPDGWDFVAYKRADISSMYQEPPGSRVEQVPDFTGQAGKFVNMSPERLDLYW